MPYAVSDGMAEISAFVHRVHKYAYNSYFVAIISFHRPIFSKGFLKKKDTCSFEQVSFHLSPNDFRQNHAEAIRAEEVSPPRALR